MSGFMMITTDIGTDVPRLASDLREVPQVVRVDRVTGPYDLICTLEADGVLELEKAAAWQARPLQGIAKTSMHIPHPYVGPSPRWEHEARGGASSFWRRVCGAVRPERGDH